MKEKRIIWSPIAEQTYLNILSQILELWTLKEAENFEAKVESLIEKLKKHNRLCPSSNTFKNLRRCVITTQTSLVYQNNADFIELVAFFDNRAEYLY